MKRIYPIIALFLTFIFQLSCNDEIERKGNLEEYIPQGALAVYKIANWDSFTADFENNSVVKEFKNDPFQSSLISNSEILKTLHPESSTLLSFNKVDDSLLSYTFITRSNKNLMVLDSLKDKSVETLTYENKEIKRITINGQKSFLAVIDSIFIASSSQKLLEGILNGGSENASTFKKLFGINTGADFAMLLKDRKIALSDSSNVKLANWSAMDVSILPNAITATGIAIAWDSIPQLLTIFEGQVPQANSLAEIVPRNAKKAVSFTFSDAEIFQKNLKKFRNENTQTPTTGIFETINEVGVILVQNEKIIFLKSLDPSLTDAALAQFENQGEAFREIQINSFSNTALFDATFRPLIPNFKANFVSQMDAFFIFTETTAAAQDFIGGYKNNETLKNTSYFEKATASISSSSSLLVYEFEDVANLISDVFGLNEISRTDESSSKKYPFGILQYSYDRDFAHVNFVAQEISEAIKTNDNVSEKVNLKLENPILSEPMIFNDPKIKGVETVVQDVQNKLFLFSETGKILWSYNIGSPILGSVQEVNVLKTASPQLAFVTKNGFYVVDANGKNVSGFPIKYKDEVSQPLSVFDYDNDRNYRFIVTQGKNVLLYDKQGKAVKGFAYGKAKSNIVLPPQHFRMGGKDFITIAEENGTLNILSRTGKSRVSISKKLNFSEIPIGEEDDNFVVITKDNVKYSISQGGKIGSQKLDVSSIYWYTVKGNTKVTLDDNKLRINAKLVELPLGVYSRPKIFSNTKKTLLTLTETQENKVYVFDVNGNLLNGFPVYGRGTGEISINDRNIFLVLMGDSASVIIYSF